MASLTLNNWTGGLNTKLAPWKLQPNQLTLAENVLLRDGNLTPLPGLGTAVTTGLGAGTWAWVYRLNGYWLASTVIRTQTLWQTAYLAYVEAGLPYFTNGVMTSPLGLSLPATAVTAAAGAAGLITSAAPYWVCTFVDALGQESGPSPISNTVALSLQQANLTTIPTGPTGTVARKIYRLTAGTYRWTLTLADNTTVNATDVTADANLGQPLLTEDGTAAPALQGLAINTYDGAMWGWIGADVYPSKPGAPWAWLPANTLSANVVAAGSVGSMLIYLTTDGPVRVTGSDSYTYKDAGNKYGMPVGSGRSLVLTDKGLVYWTTQGLCLTDGVNWTLLSRDALSGGDVDAYTAVCSTMRGEYSEGYYHLYSSLGHLTCDLRSGEPVFTTGTTVTGASFTALDGSLFVSVGNAIYPWAEGDPLTMRAETYQFTVDGDIYAPFHVRRTAVKTTGDVTAQYYQKGDAWGFSTDVTSNNGIAMCMAALGLWNLPSLRISGNDIVTQMEVGA